MFINFKKLDINQVIDLGKGNRIGIGDDDGVETFSGREEDNILLLNKYHSTKFDFRQSLIVAMLRRKPPNGESLLTSDGKFHKTNTFIHYYGDGRELDRIICDISQIYPEEYRSLNTWSVRERLFSVRELAVRKYLTTRINDPRKYNDAVDVAGRLDRGFLDRAICPNDQVANFNMMKAYAELLQIRIDFYRTTTHELYNDRYWEMDVDKLGTVLPEIDVQFKLTVTILLVIRDSGSWVEPVLVVQNEIGAEYWESNIGCVLQEQLRYAPLQRSFREIDGDWPYDGRSIPDSWQLIDFISESSKYKGTYLEHLMELICEPQLLRDGIPFTFEMDNMDFALKVFGQRKKIVNMLMGDDDDHNEVVSFEWVARPEYSEVYKEELLWVPFSTSIECDRWETNMRVMLECHSRLWRRQICVYSRKDISMGHTKFQLMHRFPQYIDGGAILDRWPLVHLVRNTDGSFSLLLHRNDFSWSKGQEKGLFGRVDKRAIVNRGFDISNFRITERIMRDLMHAQRWLDNNLLHANSGDIKEVISKFGLERVSIMIVNMLDKTNFRIHHQHIDRIMANKASTWPFKNDGNAQGMDYVHSPSHGDPLLWKRNGEDRIKLGRLINEGGIYSWYLTLERIDEETRGSVFNRVRLKENFIFVYAEKCREIEEQNHGTLEQEHIEEYVWGEDQILCNEHQNNETGEGGHVNGLGEEIDDDQSEGDDPRDGDYVEDESSQHDSEGDSNLDEDQDSVTQEDVDAAIEHEVLGESYLFPEEVRSECTEFG